MFKRCPLCTWLPELGTDPVDETSDVKIEGLTDTDARHAQDAIRTKLKIKLQRHVAEHMQYIALRALPDFFFHSSDSSIGSSLSVSSSKDSRESELSVNGSDTGLYGYEDLSSTHDCPVDDTEDEHWALVYYRLSILPNSPKSCESNLSSSDL